MKHPLRCAFLTTRGLTPRWNSWGSRTTGRGIDSQIPQRSKGLGEVEGNGGCAGIRRDLVFHRKAGPNPSHTCVIPQNSTCPNDTSTRCYRQSHPSGCSAPLTRVLKPPQPVTSSLIIFVYKHWARQAACPIKSSDTFVTLFITFSPFFLFPANDGETMWARGQMVWIIRIWKMSPWSLTFAEPTLKSSPVKL